ncbi:MAG: hypothetical protein R3208_15660 [Ketobacteraceae bacterium]|nr:hypothetical protein [Ketobacteraceae bacterium]
MQSDASSGYITAAWGGPDLSLLSNGGMLKSLSVPGGGGYVFPVYLSDAVESGLAQVGAQSTLELRIYDLLGGVSGNCIEVNLCSFDVHQAGTYFIHVENFTEAAVSFDLAAAWAGAGVHTLADGGDVKRYSMAPTESRIESFYVTDNVMGAMVRPGDHVSAEIITRDYRGDYDVNSSCREQMPCVINSRFGGEPVNPGPYFLRVTNEQQAQIEFNLAMAWAGEEYATLANGVTGKETALQSRDTLLEVISLPPGRKSVAALLVSDAALYVDVFDLGGSLIQSCGMEEPCIFEGTDDFYFLSATNNSEAETSVAVAAAWANESVATLQDGITDQWFSLAPGEVSLQSISVPGDITDALLMFRDIHDSVTALVFDQSGASVAGCGPHYFCSFYTWSFDAEEYFVVFRNESENDSTTFKPVVALASESTYTLANGGFRPEIVLEPNELHIESVFPSAGTGFYGAYVTPYRPSTVMSSFTMMNAHGNPGCYEPFCGFQRTMGAVFISLYNFGNEPQVTALSAAWVNGNQGSLASGSTLSGLTGAVGDQMLHSFVPDEAGQVNITTAESSVEVSVLGPSGDELISCQNACSAQVFQGNPYYFRIRFLDNAESATVTINW